MNDLNKQKLVKWTKKLEEAEQARKDAFIRKGEAASMGDLSENSAYKMAIEEIEMGNAIIGEINKILDNLKKS